MGRPIHDLRISVTDRCNFRCGYCMPAEVYGARYHFLPKKELLTYGETARLTRLFVQLGVAKVRVTGGEPLVRSQVHELVAMLAAIPGIEDLTITTNGYLLAEQAQLLKNAGLHRVTVSLDSLDPEIFGAMNGRGFTPQRVLEGIAVASAAGLFPIKINAVVQRGVNDHTVVEMARYFQGTGHILRFIEYMDVGSLNGWQQTHVVRSAELVERINDVLPIRPLEPGYRGEVAERYAYEDGSGEIGFISSVTQPFCGDCTRVRLSPEGRMITCLFAGTGLDLKASLRSGATDAELLSLLASQWRVRTDRYSELRASMVGPSPRKIEMYQIGG
jgi:cyclic pyranopterin phosphate synthase